MTTKILVIFLTQCSLNIFLSYITAPTNITRNTKTLIDKIFYNKRLSNIISGNRSSIISDYLIQFLIKLLNFPEKSSKTINRQRWYKNFDKLKFKAELAKVNSDPSDVLVHFRKILNKLLDKHAPYKTFKTSI